LDDAASNVRQALGGGGVGTGGAGPEPAGQEVLHLFSLTCDVRSFKSTR
jgi:hypothetical protein